MKKFPLALDNIFDAVYISHCHNRFGVSVAVYGLYDRRSFWLWNQKSVKLPLCNKHSTIFSFCQLKKINLQIQFFQQKTDLILGRLSFFWCKYISTLHREPAFWAIINIDTLTIECYIWCTRESKPFTMLSVFHIYTITSIYQ